MKDEVRFRVLGARRAAELTQEELAGSARCAMMSVSRWERGEFSPSSKHLAGMAKALGVSKAWLAWGDGQPCEDAQRARRIAAFVARAKADARRAA